MALRVGDLVGVRDGSKNVLPITRSQEMLTYRPMPSWLEADAKSDAVRISAAPPREEMETTIEEHLIVEYYSR
jgi:small subunit ribosomal protein S4